MTGQLPSYVFVSQTLGESWPRMPLLPNLGGINPRALSLRGTWSPGQFPTVCRCNPQAISLRGRLSPDAVNPLTRMPSAKSWGNAISVLFRYGVGWPPTQSIHPVCRRPSGITIPVRIRYGWVVPRSIPDSLTYALCQILGECSSPYAFIGGRRFSPAPYAYFTGAPLLRGS
jgi:hypothetical protein